MPHLIYIFFFFLLGSCIGSFLNVVVWRLPNVELPEKSGPIQDFFAIFKALSNPPSHCPNCNTRLKWYDNLPIIGWIKLGGKCRFCKQPISMRYPIIELVTALIFTGYYVAYYVNQVRACCPQARVIRVDYDSLGIGHEVTNPQWILQQSWPIFFLYLFLLSGLLAASLIDAELYIIPVQIPWLLAIVGFAVHAFSDQATIPGSLNLLGDLGPPQAALAAGGMLGLILSIGLWRLKIIPTSFPKGEPLEMDRQQVLAEIEQARLAGEKTDEMELPPEYTAGQIRREISKEMVFLLPPMLLGGGCLALSIWVPVIHTHWQQLILATDWLNALLGSFFGALIGAFVVWITRILGTLVFRRVAMGLGDVHLMLGVGAIIGAGGATVAFFIAPFFGILTAVYRLILRKGHEIPFGPYLALGTAAVMLLYCPIHAYLEPGFEGLLIVIGQMLHR